MQKLVLGKLVSKKETPQFSIEQLGSGLRFSLQSELDSLEGWSGRMFAGAQFKLNWSGKVFCTSCGGPSAKLVNGFCFACLNTVAAADSCVMSPHLCHYLSGTCRDASWGLAFCYQPHVVYLSYTGEFKVGITRLSQIPTRWFDQGATWAEPLALVGSRHQAGVLEKIIAHDLSERTVWQKMLKSGNERPDESSVAAWNERLKALSVGSSLRVARDLLRLRVSSPPRAPWAGSINWIDTPSQFELNYPTERLATVPKSLRLEQSPQISARIEGIKGQYLIFADGVFNVRRHEGFEVELLSG